MADPRDAARTEALDRLFHALADPTRRAILRRLTLGPQSVTELARPYRMSLPAVSKHLRVLEEARLVSRQVRGRVHRLALRGTTLAAAEAWLDPFRSYWQATMEALEDDLRRYPPRTRPRPRRGISGRSGRTSSSGSEAY